MAFLRDGTALGVPRADGSLSSRPLTRGDYAPSSATAERAYHREHEDRDIDDAARRRRETGRCKVRENPSTACSGVR
nr:hypothetical protein [Micromonospora noduli]